MNIMRIIEYLWENPLGTGLYACNYFKKINWIPGIQKVASTFETILFDFQFFLDSSFDRKYSTDTSGRIHLKDLTIIGNNIEYGTWYGAMSPKHFKQIMHHLNVNFNEFQFIDFGSGKGRALLMASDYGFNKIIGIEFAEELHHIANNNVSVYERYTKKPTKIENIFEDATNYIIPDWQLIIFFNSPFTGNVMKQVLENISSSLIMYHRKIYLIFYGLNPQSIELFKATVNFQGKEIKIDNDWTKFLQLRCFLFTSQ